MRLKVIRWNEKKKITWIGMKTAILVTGVDRGFDKIIKICNVSGPDPGFLIWGGGVPTNFPGRDSVLRKINMSK